jgi:hypothetical protein
MRSIPNRGAEVLWSMASKRIEAAPLALAALSTLIARASAAEGTLQQQALLANSSSSALGGGHSAEQTAGGLALAASAEQTAGGVALAAELPPLGSPRLAAVVQAQQAALQGTTTLDGEADFSTYLRTHAGFFTAILTLIMMPVVIFLGCCLERRCRRAQKLRAAAKKKRADADGSSGEDERQQQTGGDEPSGRPPVLPAKLARGPGGPAPPKPPVRVDPALLPVDAYLGVPPVSNLL